MVVFNLLICSLQRFSSLFVSLQYAREILPLHKADKNWRCKKTRFQFRIIREQCALYCSAGFKKPFSLIHQKITGNLLEGDGLGVLFPEFEPEINNFFKDKNTGFPGLVKSDFIVITFGR